MQTRFKKIVIIFLMGFFGFFNFLNFQVQAVDEVKEAQDKLKKLENQAQDVTADLQQSQGLLQKTTSQVITTQSLIEKTSSEISRKEAEVKNLNDRIKLNRKILSEYIRQAYYNTEEKLIIEVVFREDNLSGILGNLSQSLGVRGRILNLLEEIKKSKDELEKNKTELADKKEEHEELLVIKKNEQSEIQQDVQEAKITLGEIQKKMSKLRSMLSAFLGKSFTLDDVVREVKYASGKTGVRKEFLFAMLDKETDLGRYTGGCYYDKGKNPVKKHMKSADQSAFVDLMDELGYGDNDQKLSCWPGYGYGGAMGIAQFMPSTWLGYKDAIKKYTGHNPPNPWNITDGIIGMAEKLKRAGAASKSKEHFAAKVYYCGGPGSSFWNTRCEAYADMVISWSKGYDDYF